MIWLLRRLLVSLGFVFWFGLSAAQAQDTLNYDRFDSFAGSVEISIENGRLSDVGFEGLRDALVSWREDFLEARGANSVQIEALEAQIDALGALPAEGETEPAAIATRRDALNAGMQEALAPRIAADEAYARADALIGQIDATLRARQADALFELSRTPLDPTLWGPALAAIGAVNVEVREEVSTNLETSSDQSALWQRAFIGALIVGLALILVIWAPRVMDRVLTRIETTTQGDNGRVVFGFLLSFGNVLIAMIGVSLLSVVLISSDILGETGRAVAIGINAAILSFAVARWLSGRTFPKRSAIPTILTLDPSQRARGRYAGSALGILTGLLMLVEFVDDVVVFDTDLLGVISLPLFVLMALVLYQLGGLVHLGGHTLEGETPAFSDRVERVLGRGLQLLAVVGLIATLIGLQNLARGVLLPAALSLGLLAFLTALHFAFQAGYAMLRGLDGDEARQALAPVLFSLVLTLAAVPIFALFWGARDSDLDEAWTRFKTGIPLGDGAISPVDFLTFAAVFAVIIALTRLLQGTLRSSVLPRTKMDVGGRNAIVSGLGYLGITIAVITGITAAGIDLSSFAIVIGALGVGIGFGLQNIVNNFVSGIILLLSLIHI